MPRRGRLDDEFHVDYDNEMQDAWLQHPQHEIPRQVAATKQVARKTAGGGAAANPRPRRATRAGPSLEAQLDHIDDEAAMHGVFFAAGDDDEYFDFGPSEIETSTKDALTRAQQNLQQAAQKQAQMQDTTMRRANALAEDSFQNLAVSPGGGGWFRPSTRGVSGVSGMGAMGAMGGIGGMGAMGGMGGGGAPPYASLNVQLRQSVQDFMETTLADRGTAMRYLVSYDKDLQDALDGYYQDQMYESYN